MIFKIEISIMNDDMNDESNWTTKSNNTKSIIIIIIITIIIIRWRNEQYKE